LDDKYINLILKSLQSPLRRDATGEEVDFTNPSVTGTGEGDVDIDGNEENNQNKKLPPYIEK